MSDGCAHIGHDDRGEEYPCPHAALPVWCPGHREAILTCLRELPTWVQWLQEEAHEVRGASSGERLGKTPKKPAPPSPSASVDVLEALAQWCHEWTVVVASNLRHVGPAIDTPVGTPHLDGALTAGHRYLLAQSEFWLGNDDLLDLGRELFGWRGRVTHHVRRDDFVNELNAPCPQCDKIELFRRNGSDYVECRRCDLVWPEDQYQRLVVVLTS